MKSFELRQGNYIMYEKTTHVVKGVVDNIVYSWWIKDNQPHIDYIKKDIGGVMVENPYIDSIINYEPIPLTKEWLEDFKFSLNEKLSEDETLYKEDNIDVAISSMYFIKDGITLCDNSKYDSDLNVTGFGRYTISIEDITIKDINYVHELQNFFLENKGEQLLLR